MHLVYAARFGSRFRRSPGMKMKNSKSAVPRAPFAGHVHRGCRHRTEPSALSRKTHTHEEPLDRKPAPNALGRRCRTAERPGPGRRLSFHDLNETKSARARERGEPIVAGRAERYVRIVTRLRFYRDVLEHVAARKSRAREPLRRVLGPPLRRSSKRAIRLFPLAARMTSVDVDVDRSRRQAPRPARAQNRLVPLRRR